MSINFLFWNLNKKYLKDQIYNLAIKHDVDVFLFAECKIPPTDLLNTLNRFETKYHYSPPIGCDKIEIYTKFSSNYIQQIKETSRITIRKLNLPTYDEILVVAVHLPSKLNWSNDSQAMECTEIAKMIDEAETKVNHKRTILVGDLNMNPFEKGMVAANGLHGIMSREIASKGHRTLQGRKHIFFYNPMWNFLGDMTGPPGSFYYNSSQQINYYWQLLDQVLIRPELLKKFDVHKLKILDSDGINSFLNSENIPDASAYSDHLPLFFSLED